MSTQGTVPTSPVTDSVLLSQNTNNTIKIQIVPTVPIFHAASQPHIACNVIKNVRPTWNTASWLFQVTPKSELVQTFGVIFSKA
jgi:hypothetical protein